MTDEAVAPLRGVPSYPPRIVSGVQPSPVLHLGHYFGAMENLITLQHEYPGDTFYVIADQHALSQVVRGDERDSLPRITLDLTATLLATGLDPNKSVLYRQSDVPECMELLWYLSCTTDPDDVEAAPGNHGSRATLGTRMFPVLMAADVLALRGTVIATGHDQQANADWICNVARRFNERVGEAIFPIPEVRYSGDHVVPGTDGEIMSAHEGNEIGLFQPYYELQEQVESIDLGDWRPGIARIPEGCTLFRLYRLMATEDDITHLANRYRGGDISPDEARRELTHVLQEFLADADRRYQSLRKRPDYLRDVLRAGVRQARQEAATTLECVRSLYGIAA